MDRRSFTKLALSGLAFSFVADSAGRAASLGETLPTSPAPATPRSVPDGPLATQPYAKLLERAKAALDQHGHMFELRDRVALADFNAPSRELRFHVVDLIGGQASSYLVAHGRGSDPGHSGWLQSFSNEPNSLASCSGAFKTGEIYEGQHGRAIRLMGLDPQNNNAEMRAIVVHGADYVSEDHIATWGKIGRSEGCFALARHMLPQFIGLIGPGRMLYADKIIGAPA
ncbi:MULTISPECIES: murein L,D-transpeptidase catalytic domain family protein [Sphingobium]|uniref:Twin-arginine translocation pathway signal protein n=1 Tax=Sphingobium chungbukense TaxID=56193 RepID=A0A0M3AQG2_9SPHN|nr:MULTISPECIES: murein L,D-transpeptidase catalytic domain family protein [Sphingobium]KKW92158.1 twin-arginine translocation pathway signal protein [Sphingobium chungbukense]PJG48987.1 twin-arginine translocation pathway signal protein [Sphingobium sp. LB126]